MISKAKTHKSKRLKSLLLAILFTVSLLPPVEVRAVGNTYTFDSGAVVLDSFYDGDTVFIHNGVFSVTVVGATDVSIRFVDVVIDRRHDPNTGDADPLHNTVVDGLYAASQKLGWNGKAPVCPFLITGGSTVTAGFTGECTFYAGTNGSEVSSDDTYTASRSGGGYAGIQVDAGSSLTITDAEDLKVYGAHQLGVPDEDGNVTNGNTTASYEYVLRANVNIPDAGYDDPYDNQWNACQTHNQFTASGGAGIGGGVAYNTNTGNNSQGSASPTYTQGTPGTIIINGGNIETFGGYAAAGIGGSVNGAATKSEIIINGGNVIAHGGRFAAGIGDGDSVPVSGTTQGPSPDFRDATGRIEINGGTVTAYGGVASAGIGCTDDICDPTKGYGADARSQLEIAINGGAVNAFSGFPDGFDGADRVNDYPSETPAAIGAGSKSQMESNSIYISSAATLTCAGFGNYSLTENGTSSNTVPVINVDSDGYLLLLRTEKYFSDTERKLELWQPQSVINPDTEAECLIYADQTTGKIYYVDVEYSIVYDTDFNQLTAAQTPEHLTLYVDENSVKLDEIDLAFFFRSIALSLPHPEQYGGLYALTVPVEGIPPGTTLPDAEDIILTVDAKEQGTQSGYIDYPSPSNMGMDGMADKLTDLDVYTDNTQLPTNGLIGDDFAPGVFAYTVYVEPDVNKVTLRAEFKDGGKTYKLTLDNTQLTLNDRGDTIQVSSTVDLTGVQQKTVRLKKMDNNSTLGAIVYKVTVIKKSVYELVLSDPTKVYDGNPVQVGVTSMGYDGIAYVPVDKPGTAPSNATSWVAASRTATYNSTVYLDSRDSTANVANVAMTLRVIAVSNQNAVQYVLSVATTTDNGTVNNRGTWAAGWQVAYGSNGSSTITRLASKPNNNISGTWLGSGTTSQRIASGNAYTNRAELHLILNNATGTAQLRLGSSNTIATIFSIADVTSTDDRFVDDRTSKEAAAKTAIKAGSTEGSFPYASYNENTLTQALTVQTVSRNGTTNTPANQTVSPVTLQSTKKYTSDGAGTWEIKSETQFVPVSLPAEDLEQVTFTYYQVWAANGTPITEIPLGSTPPTDAGTYRVEAELRTETYNAFGNRSFTISRREVRVQQITNWLLYVKTPPAAGTLAITDPGAILLENVVSGDDVSLSVDYENGYVYYKETSLSYAPDKITLQDATLIGDRAFNYYLHYDDGARVRIFVFGQISLDVEGSTFRKTQDGEWRKYYPQSDGDPVGTADNTPDYHSPIVDGTYRAHAEYIRARTVNHDAGTRYAVDIEYGAMQFGFYRGMWDVNQLSYVENTDSVWVGMDGTNNRIILTNYSNAEIHYKISAVIKPFYAAIDEVRGIRAKIAPDAGGNGVMDTWTSVAAATPGDSGNTGSSGSGECYLFLSGVPQMQESSTYIEVGTITVTVAPAAPGGS